MSPTTFTPLGRRLSGRLMAICVLAAALAATLLVVTAGPATAHAAVRSTTPFDGAHIAIEDVPSQVTIEFNEDVVAPPGAIRVFDEDGARVDVDGPVEGLGSAVVGRALGDVQDGGFVVTWSVVSTDGHPIHGAFVFSVGDGAAPSGALVSQVFGGASGAIGPAQTATTWVTYVGVLLAAGAVLTARALRRPATGSEETWIRSAALMAVVASVVTVPLQAAAASNDGLQALVAPTQLLDVLVGSVGVAVVVRVLGLAAVVSGRGPLRLLGSLVALGSFLVDGHTRTVEPMAVVVGADAAHLIAGAVWFGGLVLLLQRVRGRRLADDPVGGAALVRDWSRVAGFAVATVVVAGSALSWATVRSLDALSTGYGITLLVKIALALLVIALGIYNHFRVVPAVERAVVPVPAGGATAGHGAAIATGDDTPRGPIATASTEAGWQRLGTTVRLEVGLLVTILAVTGWLQSQRPAAEELGIGGALLASEQLTDEWTLDVVVDPNVAGVNTIHLYLLDETGRTVSGVEGIRLEISNDDLDIGPIEREAVVAGPGHWTLTGRELALPGTWDIRAVVRVDTFTEESITVRTVVGS